MTLSDGVAIPIIISVKKKVRKALGDNRINIAASFDDVQARKIFV